MVKYASSTVPATNAMVVKETYLGINRLSS
jgi:hypothetical protein